MTSLIATGEMITAKVGGKYLEKGYEKWKQSKSKDSVFTREGDGVKDILTTQDKPEFSGDWANYNTHGITDSPFMTPEGRRLVIEFENAGYNRQEAVFKASDLMSTGSTLPIANPVEVGDTFYKIVPNGSLVGPKSPFWMTESEVKNLRGLSTNEIANVFGIPLKQQKNSFSLYKIKANSPSISFTSKVAPTSELGKNGVVWKQAGGGNQSLLIDRENANFSEPILLEKVFK